MALKPAVSTVQVHIVGMAEPITLSWREDYSGGAGDCFTLTPDDGGPSITLGMLGPNRITLDISAVDPDNAV